MQCQWVHVHLLLYILKAAFKTRQLHNGLQPSDLSQVLNWYNFFLQLDMVIFRHILVVTHMFILKQD